MSNRNRYTSNPTYNADKRSFFSRKNATPAQPAPQPPPLYREPYPQQQNPGAGYMNPYPQSSPYPYQTMNAAGQAASPYPYASAGAYPGYPPGGAPLQPQQPSAPPPSDYTVLPAVEDSRQPQPNSNTWVGILMLLILPALFVITLLTPDQLTLKWLFIAVSAIGLCGMWFFSSFASSAKTTLSMIYTALALMTAVTLMVTPDVPANPPRNDLPQGQTSQGNALPGFIPTTNETPPPGEPANQTGAAGISEPDTSSEAATVLKDFFYFWGGNQSAEMIKFCAPSWQSSLSKSPETELFSILKNRIPSDLVIESISGTDANSSRTITCTAMIDARNTRPPSKVRFQIIMLKEGGAWYVSPVSLTSNIPVETPDPQAAQALNEEGKQPSVPTVTPVTDSKTKLYYNADGGKYYHLDANCSSIAQKYLPLKSFFYYQDVSTSKFKALLPCLKCNAPGRP